MEKLLIKNKKAYFDFFIIETYECGIELKGAEVKSIVEGRASIKEAWVKIKNGEAYIVDMNISPY
ncbi:MAG: SsrA-binding protein, partial [Thermoanaerobaculia bacterium]